MKQQIADIAFRIRSLRDDLGISAEEMAQATGRSVDEYLAQESGEKDLSFTFLYKCSEKLGVDVIEILTGETPHLTGYSLVRKGAGLTVSRREGFEYQHIAPTFEGKLAEPFVVTAPYSEAEQQAPIHLSRHDGQEFDYVLSGKLRFAYEDHIEELEPGDAVFYDSGRGHGMIATGGQPCTFIAVVIRPHIPEIQ